MIKIHFIKYLFILVVFWFASVSCFAQLKNYDISEYGALGDGKTVNTKALQSAIDACHANGGGDVIVPTGVFIIGTVYLKSNVHLYLQSGAIIRGSGNLADYEPYTPEKPFVPIHKGMFFAEDAENISITGEGQIDGNGDNFFELDQTKKLDATTTQYTRQKNNFRHVASGIGDGPVIPKDRPYQMFVFSNCRRITVKDIFITNAPFWCMHFADCDSVHVSGIRLWNNMLAPNADGIDITSSSNVVIDNCDIRTGDDSLVVGGYDHHFEIPGFKHLRHDSGNVVISNCNLQSSSSGIRIGFLDQNTVRNVQVSNVNITNSTRGVGVFLRDEGSLENITFSNLNIETKLRTGDWWGNGEPIHVSAIRGKENVKLGQIRHLKFNHIICRGEAGILVYGTDESVIEDVAFNDVDFELTGSKLNNTAGGNIDLRGVLGEKNGLFARDIPGFLAQYVSGLTINDFKLQWTNSQMPFLSHGIEVNNFKDVRITNFKGTGAPNNSKAYPVEIKNGVGFETDLKKKSVHKIAIK
ncbi:MAG: glycosyl hydrolase family 28 protein [Pyrinomonadaceae bacterium]